MVLSETGYQRQLSESEDEEDQQRLANIEELLTVARDFDERSVGRTAWRLFGRDVSGERYRRLGNRRRPGYADDAARLEGPGVPGGVSDGR